MLRWFNLIFLSTSYEQEAQWDFTKEDQTKVKALYCVIPLQSVIDNDLLLFIAHLRWLFPTGVKRMNSKYTQRRKKIQSHCLAGQQVATIEAYATVVNGTSTTQSHFPATKSMTKF